MTTDNRLHGFEKPTALVEGLKIISHSQWHRTGVQPKMRVRGQELRVNNPALS